MVILNPVEVYGPNDTSLVTAGNLKNMICDWPVIIPSTGGTAICHVEDVASAVAAAVTRGRSGQRYILGGPCLSVRQASWPKPCHLVLAFTLCQASKHLTLHRLWQLATLTLTLAGEKTKRTPIISLPSWLLVAVVGASCPRLVAQRLCYTECVITSDLLAKLGLPTPVEPGVLKMAVVYWCVS